MPAVIGSFQLRPEPERLFASGGMAEGAANIQRQWVNTEHRQRFPHSSVQYRFLSGPATNLLTAFFSKNTQSHESTKGYVEKRIGRRQLNRPGQTELMTFWANCTEFR